MLEQILIGQYRYLAPIPGKTLEHLPDLRETVLSEMDGVAAFPEIDLQGVVHGEMLDGMRSVWVKQMQGERRRKTEFRPGRTFEAEVGNLHTGHPQSAPACVSPLLLNPKPGQGWSLTPGSLRSSPQPSILCLAMHPIIPLYDAHNHLHAPWLQSQREQIRHTLENLGLQESVVNGSSQADWPQVLNLAKEIPWVIPSLGLHPWDVGNRGAHWYDDLRMLLLETPGAQVGEIGLDRWMLDRAKPDDPRLTGLRRASIDEQTEIFSQQFELSVELDRIPSIHCLDAYGTLLECLRSLSTTRRGFLLHSYNGSAEMVASFDELGAYFSFNGAFLDPKRTKVHEAFRQVPIERLLVETDAPAMAPPKAWRKFELPNAEGDATVNHPANIQAVYEGLSGLLGMPVEELARRCEENFERLFLPRTRRSGKDSTEWS